MRKMMVDEERTKDDITLYALRHTYCTTLLRPPPNGAGLDIRTVQLRMGHSDIRTTEQYLRDIEPEKHPTDALPY
jgi:site-specific recombinase XerD